MDGKMDPKPLAPNNPNATVSSPRAQDAKISLDAFRVLLGIPQAGTRSDIAPATLTRSLSSLPRSLQRKPPNPEYETSLYYTIVLEERHTVRLYRLYDVLVYSCMISQLIIASILVILGAIAGDHHIAVAVLGASTGVLTGILSLIKGQGLPNRLVQYGDGLRKVRESIEFTERELRAGARDVTFGDVEALKMAYEAARDDESRNRPDQWATAPAVDVEKAVNRILDRRLRPLSKTDDLSSGEQEKKD